MSYINDALRKVQKDKDSRYVGYDHILSAPGKELNTRHRRLPVAGILVFLLFAAGIIVLLYFSTDKIISLQKTSTPPVKAPAVVAQQELAPSVPAEIKPPQSIATVETKSPIEKPPAAEKKMENSSATVTRVAKSGREEISEKVTAATPTVSAKTSAKDTMTDAKALYAQALKKHQEGNLDEAKKLYKQVIKIDPNNVQALNNLGVVYMKKKVYKWAIIRLNDALKIKPDYADAHYNLACVYAKTNDTESSLLRLKDAIDLNPEVKKWVKNDRDLDNISNLSGYKKLMENQKE